MKIAAEIAENYEEAEPHRYPIEGIPPELARALLCWLCLCGNNDHNKEKALHLDRRISAEIRWGKDRRRRCGRKIQITVKNYHY